MCLPHSHYPFHQSQAPGNTDCCGAHLVTNKHKYQQSQNLPHHTLTANSGSNCSVTVTVCTGWELGNPPSGGAFATSYLDPCFIADVSFLLPAQLQLHELHPKFHGEHFACLCSAQDMQCVILKYNSHSPFVSHQGKYQQDIQKAKVAHLRLTKTAWIVKESL